MNYLGELISIGVAFSWTATALLSELGSKRMGNLTLNVLRMALALLFSVALFWYVTGSPMPYPLSSIPPSSPLPPSATIPVASATGLGALASPIPWMLLSGLVGYVIGDFCLFQCYILIGSRYGQLFMTLAPLAAALTAWVTMGQQMTVIGIVAMFITLAGIAISIYRPHHESPSSSKSPFLRPFGSKRAELERTLHPSPFTKASPFTLGVLFAIAAAVCQGVGLVLSKIGMDHYAPGAMPAWLVPFSANFLRCLVGLVGFTLMLLLREGFAPLRHVLHDRKGMAVATATTIFGPFVGVGFSLMAVQYTSAGIASTLMALTPIIIILPSYWLFRQPVTWRAVVGAFISVVGVSLFFLE